MAASAVEAFALLHVNTNIQFHRPVALRYVTIILLYLNFMA